MISVLPKIKKRISNYITSETGQISKQSILTIGVFVGTAALASLAATKVAKAGLTAEIAPAEGKPVTLKGTHSSYMHYDCGESCGQACGESCPGECDPTCEASCQSVDMGCAYQDMGGCSTNVPPGTPHPPPGPCGQGCGGCEGLPCEDACQQGCQTSCQLNCQCQNGECVSQCAVYSQGV